MVAQRFMGTIEIRYVRKFVSGLIIFMVTFVIGISILMVLLETANWWWLIQFGLVAFFLYRLAKFWFIIRKNDPAIIISTENFSYNINGRVGSSAWKDITDVQLEHSDGKTELRFNTHGKRHVVDLNWLEKNPETIKQLVDQYKAASQNS